MTRIPQSEIKARLVYRKEHGSEEGFVPPPRKRRSNEEWEIQASFFRWWRSAAKGLGVWSGSLYHIPNGSMLGDDAKSRAIRAKMLALAGVVPGVPDTFLSVPRGRFSGMYIEFKRPGVRNHKYGGCSCEQVEFMSASLGHGYRCVVCYSWEGARETVLEYLANTAGQPRSDSAAPALGVAVGSAWNSVADKMPPIGADVLTWGKALPGYGPDVRRVYRGSNNTPDFGDGWGPGQTFEVTHWAFISSPNS